MKSSLRLTSLLIALLAVSPLFGQMEIIDGATPPVDPESLITNIFLGDGVEVLNVNYEGDPLAVGLFTNGEAAVGIDRGIVLTSGRAASPNCNGGTVGANCNGNQFSSFDNAGPQVDADLSTIAGQGVFDVARYTITFIPTSDTLRFRYVFASEEYPEYACTNFNDVFGFFLSGPGITGPFANAAENIALIPGTDIPVTINNVNDAGAGGLCPYDYTQYYNDNQVAQQPVYDGYLDVFTAEYVVTPCETYTMKLAISDAGDGIFDTGVFLEAKSFGTGSLLVETATVSLDGTITEGCSDGSITFSLPNEAEEDYILDYTIIGTAINGVDYLDIPLDLFIPEGDTAVNMDIIAIVDALDEGLESIGIDIQRDICNRDTFWIFIRDNEIVPPDLGPDSTLCSTDSMTLDGTLPIPLPVPPAFTNEQDYPVPFGTSVFSPILVAGVQPINLGPGVIQSVCVNIDHNWVDDLDLFLISPGGQFIELSTDNGQDCDDYPNTCFTPTATTLLTDVVAPGYDCAGGESTDFVGEFAVEGFWEDLWDGDYPTNGNWQLLVQDDAMGFDGTLLDWTITFEPLYQVFYEWSPADGLSCIDCPDPVASPTQSTTYTLTAYDTYGCEVSDSITIQVQDVLPAPNVNCVNVTNNSITFEWDPVPGAMGYQVSIDGATFTVPNNGVLSHIVTGLLLTQEVTIEVFAIGLCDGEIGTVTCETPGCDAPSLEIVAQTNLDCAGDTNGSVTVQASGGAGNYTYELDGNSNDSGVFDGLEAGTYPVTVIDDWMCPNTIQVNISAPDSIMLEAVLINDITCFSANDGSATVAISGGVYPYQFEWSNGEADSIAISLTPGMQTLNVTDANGCSAAINFDILEPIELTASTSADSVDCFTASTGSVLVSPQGGTEPLLIQWDAAAGDATTALVEELPAGSYTVVVSDLNGCQVTSTVIVEEPDGMTTSMAADDINCPDSGDGTASINVQGGEPDYEYLWSNGQVGNSADMLNAETYSVTVTDANGCSVQDSITVGAPPPIFITLLETDALCFGSNDGTVTADVMGGSGAFEYLWNTGDTSPELPNVAAGQYCLTVTDENDCTQEQCIEVFQPNEIVLDTEPTDAGCNGGTAGEVNLTIVSGGTGPFTFIWSNGEITEDITSLGVGTYEVTVTDANECSAVISQTINESDAVELTSNQTNLLCNGASTGSIDVTATGGSGGFTFDWTGPNNYFSDLEDPQNLEAGIYNVIAEDTDGCSTQLQIEITEPATPVSVIIVPPMEICFGADNGSAIATASGGTPGYTFEWSNGGAGTSIDNLTAGSYTVTVTDLNGCQAETTVAIVQQPEISMQLSQNSAGCFGSNDGTASIASITQGGTSLSFADVQIQWSFGGASTPEIMGLTGGETYSVTVTNTLGCTAVESITIDNPVEIGAALITSENTSCFNGADGSATVTGEGGTLPYSYLWDANASNQTNASANGLGAGVYMVTISDLNGCSTLFETTIGEPTALDLSFENVPVNCFGGADGNATVIGEGGTSPYFYTWENGQNGTQSTELEAGIWSLTMTDANGCELISETEITQPGEPLLAQFTSSDVTCYAYQDGNVSIAPEGGSPPYMYSLDGIDFYGTPTFVALNAGDYTAYVRDDNGCIFEVNDIIVEEPEPISVDAGPDVTVFYGTNVQIPVDLFGIPADQIPNIEYSWTSNNPLNPVLFPKSHLGIFIAESPTSAVVTITTENGCTAEDLVNIFVQEYRNVEVPTGFTPRPGGGPIDLNDALHVHGNSLLVDRIKVFQVFDRWGELLFEVEDFDINDTTVGWDGTFKGEDMPAGVYVWYLEVDFIDGETIDYKGHTTLIR